MSWGVKPTRIRDREHCLFCQPKPHQPWTNSQQQNMLADLVARVTSDESPEVRCTETLLTCEILLSNQMTSGPVALQGLQRCQHANVAGAFTQVLMKPF